MLLEWLSSRTPSPISVGEDVGKKEPLYTAGVNISWYIYFGKQYGDSLKN
jgi:hypothetical protein